MMKLCNQTPLRALKLKYLFANILANSKSWKCEIKYPKFGVVLIYKFIY